MHVNIFTVEEKPDVITQIYQQYYGKIYKYTLYRVGDHCIAEDLVSEVFEKVVGKYYTYNPEKSKLSTWLFTIVNNVIINYYKKNTHHAEPLELGELASSYSLEDLVLEREQKDQLLKAILGLPEQQRNIIALKFGAGLTNREISQMTDLTESNVGTILYRALKQLRNILTGQGGVSNE